MRGCRVADIGWQDDALCHNTDSNLYDLEWVEAEWGISKWAAQDEYAQALCAGCPVMRECAKSAMEPFDIADYALTPDGSSGVCYTEGVVQAGMALRPVRREHRAIIRKRLAAVAGVEWTRLPSHMVRRNRVCVDCGDPFEDVGGWVRRWSSRVCVDCHQDRVGERVG